MLSLLFINLTYISFLVFRMLLTIVLLALISTLTAAQNSSNDDEGHHCVWYGQCSINWTNGYAVNCPYTGPGIVEDDPDTQDLLLEYCPDIYKDSKFLPPQTACINIFYKKK